MIQSGYARFHPSLEPLMVPVDSVCQHVDNPNNGSVEEIVVSIETSGMYRPLYVQRSTGYILAGNHTWEACKLLEATEVPVLYLDVDDQTAKKILLADNRIASLAVPDPALLMMLLNDQAELTGTGFTQRDLDALTALSQIGLDNDDFAQWPVITVRVPPHVRRAYYHMTRETEDDRERFELLLRLAGWDGT